MSEQTGELPAKVERESGVVQRVAERVGKFLSENYTLKGARAKELRGLDRMYGGFTPSQQQQMREYFTAKGEKNAKWKVIRNWVATGAGLALGGWVAAVGPDKAALAVMGVAGHVAEWWTATAVPALAKTGAAISAPFAAAGGAIKTEANKLWVNTKVMLDYMFDFKPFAAGVPWDKLKPNLNLPPFNPPKITIPYPDFSKVIPYP